MLLELQLERIRIGWRFWNYEKVQNETQEQFDLKDSFVNVVVLNISKMDWKR